MKEKKIYSKESDKPVLRFYVWIDVHRYISSGPPLNTRVDQVGQSILW